MTLHSPALPRSDKQLYNRLLLLIAGLGGLLYGIDVGIIGSALPYLQATSNLTPSQTSIIVAAVLLGTVLSTLFAGLIADAIGRKKLMMLSGLAFSLSIPIIALSHGYGPLFFGRLLQGMSGGLIGIVVPLYLAECLPASVRGGGTAIFQWMLTFGIVVAAFIGIYYSYRVEDVARLGNAAATFAYKNEAWRRIFWMSLPPGLLFILGSFYVAESPRWLYRRGRVEAAEAALLRSRSSEKTALELEEIREAEQSEQLRKSSAKTRSESLLRAKYVKPFLLACAVLALNTATGVNSVISYNTGILMQSGLSDLAAHWGYVLLTVVNFAMTLVGVTLVDRKGRRFLFMLGSAGITLSLTAVALLFLHGERGQLNCTAAVQAMVKADNTLTIHFGPAEAATLLKASGYGTGAVSPRRSAMTVIYSYGGFTGETGYLRTDAPSTQRVARRDAVPDSRVSAFFSAPFANLAQAQTAPLRIERASIAAIPSPRYGWEVALLLYCFMAFYALGPGVCVWIALSELMPTRIRSNGMSIALVGNQLVSAVLLGIFLPFVSQHGYSSMFFLYAGCTLVYFLVAAFLIPETKGKTLEEIEQMFAGAAHEGARP